MQSSSVVHPKEIYHQKKIKSGRLIEAYREWLLALNYEKNSIKYGPEKIKEFFEWLYEIEIAELGQITDEIVKQFFESLSNRKNKRTGGGLSTNYLRGYQRELRRFSRYLTETGQGHIEVSIKIKALGASKIKREIFTRSEIKRLYAACHDDLLGFRDRAMLSVYYGCGLRRNEGVNLEVKDVGFNRGMLYVRKGKNYKQRYVPMVGRVMNDIRNYLEFSRSSLAIEGTGNGLFVGYRGGAVGGSTMGERINKLKKEAGINKTGNLHALRHSIATHLLAAGMNLEQIAHFLGHSSLGSTQIYTHLVHEEVSF